MIEQQRGSQRQVRGVMKSPVLPEPLPEPKTGPALNLGKHPFRILLEKKLAEHATRNPVSEEETFRLIAAAASIIRASAAANPGIRWKIDDEIASGEEGYTGRMTIHQRIMSQPGIAIESWLKPLEKKQAKALPEAIVAAKHIANLLEQAGVSGVSASTFRFPVEGSLEQPAIIELYARFANTRNKDAAILKAFYNFVSAKSGIAPSPVNEKLIMEEAATLAGLSETTAPGVTGKILTEPAKYFDAFLTGTFGAEGAKLREAEEIYRVIIDFLTWNERVGLSRADLSQIRPKERYRLEAETSQKEPTMVDSSLDPAVRLLTLSNTSFRSLSSAQALKELHDDYEEGRVLNSNDKVGAHQPETRGETLKLARPTEFLKTRDALITMLVSEGAVNIRETNQLRFWQVVPDSGTLLVPGHNDGLRQAKLSARAWALMDEYLSRVVSEPRMHRLFEKRGVNAPLLMALDGSSLLADDFQFSVNPRFAQKLNDLIQNRNGIITSLMRSHGMDFSVIRTVDSMERLGDATRVVYADHDDIINDRRMAAWTGDYNALSLELRSLGVFASTGSGGRYFMGADGRALVRD